MRLSGRRAGAHAGAPAGAVGFLSLLGAGLLVAACARMAPPPGGPPDVAPPRLVGVEPSSLASLPSFRGKVEFQFDEVISEGATPNTGTGTGDLERLVVLSPTTRVPDVSWERTRIVVKPREGWQPNRVYRVQLLPGVTDLRRNRTDTGVVVTFTTGAPRPRTTLRGLVVDWSTRRPAPNALVDAVLLPDSLPYRVFADSSGRFRLGPLPQGRYLVAGVVDQNQNGRRDPREAYDTARVASGASDVGELWAFVHDSSAPRIQNATVTDSTGATLAFSQSLSPRLRLDTSAVRLRLLPDSTPVALASLLPKPLDDSLHAPSVPRDSTARDSLARDSLAAAKDTTDTAGGPGRTAEPLTSRPALVDQLVLRVRRPWTPGARYALTVRRVRTLGGGVGDVSTTLVVPPRDTTRVPSDSTRAPSDSTRAPTRPPSRR